MAREAPIGLTFLFVDPTGRESRFPVDSDRAIVGTGAHCEVRLALDGVAREHAAIRVEGNTIVVELLAIHPPTKLSGVMFGGGAWPAGQHLEIGAGKLFVERVALGTTSKRYPLELLALIPAVFAMVVALSLKANSAPQLSRVAPPAPQLFASPPPSCASTDRDEARRLGADLARAGDSQRERSHFAPQDGVDAVRRYDAAIACFGIAGDGSQRTVAEASRNALRARLEEDYLMRRTRFEHAVSEDDTAGMLRELRGLSPLLAGVTGEYIEWIHIMERYASGGR